MNYLWVGLGGFLGANARYLVGSFLLERLSTGFPLPTLLINVSGSFAIGVLLTLLTERILADPAWRLFLVVGFLGGYTTFSSYSFEALALVEKGLWLRAVVYVLASNGLSLIAVVLGAVVARLLSL